MKMKPEKLPPMTEKAFSAQVVQLAHVLGWRVYRTWISIRSPSGYPDLTMCHPRHGILWAELKAEAGKLSVEQAEWLGALQAAGGHAFIWRPSDWPAIERILKGEDPALTVGTGTSGYE